jgi:hypothetical protein
MPQSGMWDYLQETILLGKVNKETSFFCGHGAGRPHIRLYNNEPDKCNCDIAFAKSAGVRFQTPKAQFEGKCNEGVGKYDFCMIHKVVNEQGKLLNNYKSSMRSVDKEFNEPIESKLTIEKSISRSKSDSWSKSSSKNSSRKDRKHSREKHRENTKKYSYDKYGKDNKNRGRSRKRT